MVDNFNKFEGIPLERGEFQYVYLMQRAKDIPTLGATRRRLMNYYPDAEKPLAKFHDEIVDLCNTLQARAYIYYTPRSYRDVHIAVLQELAQRLSGEQSNRGITNLFASFSGKCLSKKQRYWLVDVDSKDKAELDKVRQFINEQCAPEGDKMIDVVNTKNGFHLITHPFHLDVFLERFPDIDVHKSGPTLLYAP